MDAARKARNGEAGSRRGQFVPQVEGLEQRWVLASAIRQQAGFFANTLTAGVNQSAFSNIGFTINFFNTKTSSLFVNTNGNVSLNSSIKGFPPGGVFPSTLGIPIIAPFYAQVDNTTTGTITYGQSLIGGHQAFAATWTGVDYYNSAAAGHVIKLDNFQVVLINRSDTGAGNFDIEFNYDQIKWSTSTNAAGAANAHSATAGFSDGTATPGHSYELPGSDQAGAFIDGGSNGLVNSEVLSNTLGRYHFYIRSGVFVSGNTEVTNQVTPYLPFRYIYDRNSQTYRGNAVIANRTFDVQQSSATALALDEPAPGVPGTQQATVTLVIKNLPAGVVLLNATGYTASGLPYITTSSSVLFGPTNTLRIPLMFKNTGRQPFPTFMSGQLGTRVFLGTFDPTVV